MKKQKYAEADRRDLLRREERVADEQLTMGLDYKTSRTTGHSWSTTARDREHEVLAHRATADAVSRLTNAFKGGSVCIMIDASGLDRQAQIYGTYKPIDATVRSRRVSDRFRAPTDWMWTMSLRSVFLYSKDGISARGPSDD